MPRVYLNTGQKTERIKYDSVEVSGRFIQVYDDLYQALSNVGSPCAMHLLFWMVQNMGQYNQIVLNKNSRKEFISDTHNKYKDETVRSALRQLIKHGLAVSMNEKGSREALYFVNPFHFWKTGSQKDRTEAIKGFVYKLQENERHNI